MTGDDGRVEELATRLEETERRISTACAASGRSRAEVTLVVVTKFFPASDVHLLHQLGVRHLGENRHQEAVAKRADCEGLDLRWHFIGHLQSNKAAAVAAWADVVQSVDRPRLLGGLSRAAIERGRDLDVLVQVDLDPDGPRGARSGVPPEDALALAELASGTPRLRLRGVMGVAPLGGDARSAFSALAAVGASVTEIAPEATWLSAGMSGDLEAAVERGATHVRIGTAVLGKRPDPR